MKAARKTTPPGEVPAFSKVAEELIASLRQVEPNTPRRSRVRPSRPIGELVESILQENRIGRDAPEHTIREHWAELVGPASAAYSHPGRLERNLLTVLTSHAVVRNELFLHREEIVARIRLLRGCESVKALRLT
ncbi:MAG: DUF721 domain-containing protein [Opitutaceae bacterium]